MGARGGGASSDPPARVGGEPAQPEGSLRGGKPRDLHAASPPPTHPPRPGSSSPPLREGVGIQAAPSESPGRGGPRGSAGTKAHRGVPESKVPRGRGRTPPHAAPPSPPLLPPEARPARSPSCAKFANGSQVVGSQGWELGGVRKKRRRRRRGLPAPWTRFRNSPPLAARPLGPGGEDPRQPRPLAPSLRRTAPAWRLFSPGVRTRGAAPGRPPPLPPPARGGRRAGPEGAGSAGTGTELRADAAGARPQPRRVGSAPAGGGSAAGVSRTPSPGTASGPGEAARAPPAFPVRARAPNFGGRGGETRGGRGRSRLGENSTQAPTSSRLAAPRFPAARYTQPTTQPTSPRTRAERRLADRAPGEDPRVRPREPRRGSADLACPPPAPK